MKSVQGGVTTYYINDLAEYSSGVFTKFYYADGQRIAQRVGGGAPTYILTDHLGSTRYTLNQSGAKTAEMRYYPWANTHYSNGTQPCRQYTGQIHDLETGLYFYNARYYDPAIGHFTQADTIVPSASDTRSFDRYAYVQNNPIKYSDPTGHYPCAFCDGNTDRGSGIGYAGEEMVDYSDVGAGASSVQGSMNFNAARINVDLSCGPCDEFLNGEIFGFNFGKPAASGRPNITADGGGGQGGSGGGGGNTHNDEPKPILNLFRGDKASVTPEWVFQNGLVAKGDNMDLLAHTRSNTVDSGYIATSRSFEVAQYSFAGKNGYVYAIQTNRWRDVNAELGDAFWHPWQLEYAIPGPVFTYEIIGAYPLRNHELTGQFIPNPNFVP